MRASWRHGWQARCAIRAASIGRLDAVGYLIDQETLRADLRDCLRAAPDIARAVSRLAFGRGWPRDLGAVRDGVAVAARCAELLAAEGEGMGLPEELGRIAGELKAVGGALQDALTAALVDDPPHLRRDGGFVREGFGRNSTRRAACRRTAAA